MKLQLMIFQLMIIIYNQNNYDYAELLGYEKILYDKNIILTGSGDPTLKSEDLDSLAEIISQSFPKIDTLFINTKKMLPIHGKHFFYSFTDNPNFITKTLLAL